MKKVFLGILFVCSLGSQSAFAAGQVTNLTVTDIWAGGYSDNDRATTRIFVSPPIPTSTQLCTNQNPIVIYSGVMRVPSSSTTGNNSSTATTTSTSIGVGDLLQNEYYEQQYAAAITALVNGNSLSAFIIDGCTSDGKFPRANRITISN